MGLSSSSVDLDEMIVDMSETGPRFGGLFTRRRDIDQMRVASAICR